mmetsp:Transcript_19478/g.32538  ORF Transcript_19478/g.32538 Transcript_19478/m.32538 type:complete len:202 (-) Transcript_19478:722-1327(-)
MARARQQCECIDSHLVVWYVEKGVRGVFWSGDYRMDGRIESRWWGSQITTHATSYSTVKGDPATRYRAGSFRCIDITNVTTNAFNSFLLLYLLFYILSLRAAIELLHPVCFCVQCSEYLHICLRGRNVLDTLAGKLAQFVVLVQKHNWFPEFIAPRLGQRQIRLAQLECFADARLIDEGQKQDPQPRQVLSIGIDGHVIIV